jgi:hypothetical protein
LRSGDPLASNRSSSPCQSLRCLMMSRNNTFRVRFAALKIPVVMTAASAPALTESVISKRRRPANETDNRPCSEHRHGQRQHGWGFVLRQRCDDGGDQIHRAQRDSDSSPHIQGRIRLSNWPTNHSAARDRRVPGKKSTGRRGRLPARLSRHCPFRTNLRVSPRGPGREGRMNATARRTAEGGTARLMLASRYAAARVSTSGDGDLHRRTPPPRGPIRIAGRSHASSVAAGRESPKQDRFEGSRVQIGGAPPTLMPCNAPPFLTQHSLSLGQRIAGSADHEPGSRVLPMYEPPSRSAEPGSPRPTGMTVEAVQRASAVRNALAQHVWLALVPCVRLSDAGR